MEDNRNLKELSIEALSAVIGVYPWFGAARKELCVRTGADSVEQYADAAMYVASRRKLARALMGSRADCSDKDVAEIVKAYLGSGEKDIHGRRAVRERLPERRTLVVGGDYFTQSDYDTVRDQDGMTGFRFMPAEEDPEQAIDTMMPDFGNDFCTETLAQIYAEQGYYEQAKDIYLKLILAYPEKNAYFAALIEKLNREIKN